METTMKLKLLVWNEELKNYTERILVADSFIPTIDLYALNLRVRNIAVYNTLKEVVIWAVPESR